MSTRQYRCAQKGCPNTYTDLIGQGWGRKSGADCLPCYYAALIRQQGQVPEDIEAVSELLDQMSTHLSTLGWTWQHVKDSYVREATLR